MKCKTARMATVVVLASGLIAFANPVLADQSFKKLSAEWWQWVLSVPTPNNPLLDTTGADCMVGQHGAVWFLAGAFGGGEVTRTCSIPEGVELFFPVINQVSFDTPNVCGQGPDPLPVAEYRAANRAFIEGAANLSVELDGRPIEKQHHVVSKVFHLALPENNIFDPLCADLGGVPANVYSPAVDEGIYVKLRALKPGAHTLHIHAENPTANFTLDATYNLTVAPKASSD